MELRFSVPFDPGSEPDAFFDSFPSCPAVFALFPAESEVASAPYLGRSRDLRRRLSRLLSPRREHSRMFSLRGFARRIEWQIVGSTFEGQWLNYLLNRQYYPRQYRARLRLKPPPLLKLNLRNRFPRCYATRRLVKDGSYYYGPFPSLVAAEHFAAEFLDFFKIRRCVEELEPNPSHPGCIYSEMKMCLAPCYAGCTDDEYQTEVGRVVEFLDGQGKAVLRTLGEERARASEALEFEQAAKTHAKLEKITALIRQKSELARNLHDLHALVMQKGAEEKSVCFFRMWRGELRGPVALSLDENVPSPLPLDRQLHSLLDSLGRRADRSPALGALEPPGALVLQQFPGRRIGDVECATSDSPHAPDPNLPQNPCRVVNPWFDSKWSVIPSEPGPAAHPWR